MRKLSLSLTVILSVIFLAAVPLLAADPTPFPQGMKIIPPDKNTVPEKLTDLSGIWEGGWDFLRGRTQNAALAVVKLTKDEAIVVYSWGNLNVPDIRRPGIAKEPGWKRYPGCPVEKAADGHYVITVKLAQGGSLKLKQTDNKELIHVTLSAAAGEVADQTRPFTKKK